jgi:RNA polymerase sigma-70 factor, ECF subfamily
MFSTTYPRVVAYVLRRAENREAAEDAVSETFLVAWRRIDDVPEEPLPWLLGTARKVLANQRRSARRRVPDGPHSDPGAVEAPDRGTPVADRVADRDAFAAAFARLGPVDRETLTLIAWDGLEPREAAEVVGCTAAAFSVRVHRARRCLLKELEATGHSLGDGSTGPLYPPRPDAAEAR